MKKRVKNPIFLLAVSGLVYQALPLIGVHLPENTFRTLIDCVSYVLIGTGVYSSFDKGEE